MRNDNKAKAADYMDMPYTKILRRDDEGDVVGRIRELPGCTAHGSTDAEALENLREMQALWIQDCIDSGQAVPCPEPEALLSGKWVQRVPRSLHGRLASLAKREGVSLNQLVTSILSQSLAPMAPLYHVVMGDMTGLREITSGAHLIIGNVHPTFGIALDARPSGAQLTIGNVHPEKTKDEIESHYAGPPRKKRG